MILTRPSWQRAFKKLAAEQQQRVRSALARLEQSFGRPHQHAGLGLRSIGPYYECRAGLDLRILFVARHGDLILVTVGNHQTIARFVKATS
jgi:hypothetical protein